MTAPLFALSLALAAAPSGPASPDATREPATCSLIRESTSRLGNDYGDPRKVALAAAATSGIGADRAVKFKQRGNRFRGPWGRCQIAIEPGSFAARIDDIRISQDGALAVVSGGWVGGELLGSGGECYFQASAQGWQLIGCANTWSV